ncbi:uncharacterized protein LOC128958769 [Oppia nitens]|uniref:uncharacterized protein LOC128958769 n=1 Tax=Oppia nitens TaxID=1686743 RepID=UPI0023DA9AB5|nr:uncharacterized protein LOC128958769 [Oppia nitens]
MNKMLSSIVFAFSLTVVCISAQNIDMFGSNGFTAPPEWTTLYPMTNETDTVNTVNTTTIISAITNSTTTNISNATSVTTSANNSTTDTIIPTESPASNETTTKQNSAPTVHICSQMLINLFAFLMVALMIGF